MSSPSLANPKVCIIGAGAAGLISVYHCLLKGFDVTCFESNDSVGGVWDHSHHNAMYQSLVTNLPKEVMAYSPKHPFPPHLSSFLRHTDVKTYLENFARDNDLVKHIKFSNSVVRVEKELQRDSGNKDCSALKYNSWKVQHKNMVNSTEVHTSYYDMIMVCNGHFNKPNIPPIPGQDKFKGCISHAKDYDAPGAYKGMTVLLVGVKASGTDIARELQGVAKCVIASDRHWEQGITQLSSGVHVCGGINFINSAGSVVLTNGDILSDVDVVMLCTGYEYDFPFLNLDPVCEAEGASLSPAACALVTVEGRGVRKLYKHVFPPSDPTIAFVGLPVTVIPFPLFYLQAQWVTTVFEHYHCQGGQGSGTGPLPSESQMKHYIDTYEMNLVNALLPSPSTPIAIANSGDATMMSSVCGDGELPAQVLHKYHHMGLDMFPYMQDMCTMTHELIGRLTDGAVTDDAWGVEKCSAASGSQLCVHEEIYRDVSASRSIVIGGADTYRQRQYTMYVGLGVVLFYMIYIITLTECRVVIESREIIVHLIGQ